MKKNVLFIVILAAFFLVFSCGNGDAKSRNSHKKMCNVKVLSFLEPMEKSGPETAYREINVENKKGDTLTFYAVYKKKNYPIKVGKTYCFYYDVKPINGWVGDKIVKDDKALLVVDIDKK
ncbi:MAG: hypothetical protein JW874_01240 [Spirochaetales bacterium]|nr:hypothetical protein [Spirochaetales bacterium]